MDRRDFLHLTALGSLGAYALSGCAGGGGGGSVGGPAVRPAPSGGAETGKVMLGIDVLAAEGFSRLQGMRVGLVTHRHKGYVDAFGSEPFQIFEVNWALTPANFPAGITAHEYYVVTIEGRPSLKFSLDIQASFKREQHLVVPDDPGSEPGYYATVSTCLHAVPKVCSARPGVLATPVTAWHWAPDYRDLAE